jgi:alpha-1,6-mannosyltransferase
VQTSPFYAYFLIHLPRLLQCWLPCALYACWVDTPALVLLAPAFAFVGLLSLLGHKEWRFIVYVVPLFNIAALQGQDLLCVRSAMFIASLIGPAYRQARLRRFAAARRLPCPSLYWLLLLPTLAFTLFVTWLSQVNYPGGHAMAALHRLRGGAHAGTPRPRLAIPASRALTQGTRRCRLTPTPP